MARTLDRQVAEVFLPLLNAEARYLGAWGGRGGAKSHFFAEQLIEDSLYFRSLLCVCIREVQRSLAQSSKRLIEMKLREFGLGEADGFKIFREAIETPGDGIIIFNGMQDHTADSVKSLESFNRGWFEEAQAISAYSLSIARPSFFRVKNCQLFFSWNPKEKPDPDHPERSVDGLLRGPHPPPGTIIVESQFYDNPWLPDDLKLEEQHDRAHRQPEDYAHIWLGAYQTRSEARVFQNWRVVDFIVPEFATFLYGADFGFSVDPSVLLRMFIGRWGPNGEAVADSKGRVLFICNEVYRVGCDIDHTPALFAGDCPFPATDLRHWKNPRGDIGIPGALSHTIVADSARPETISYMQRHGFPKMEAAIKGAGSVEEGVNFLKSFDEIAIRPSCKHTADEFLMYSWEVDPKTMLILPKLADKKNHVIDAARYGLEKTRRSSRGFFD